MNDLSSLLEAATAAIEDKYFRLPIDGGQPVYRERVYCYELYHQLRRIWPSGCSFTLNGEVDKSGHPLLRALGADRYKPDFLVHTPGSMDSNFTVIEVKPCGAPAKAIRKDLETLNRFTSAVGYQRGIYLIFGDGTDATVTRIRRQAAAVQMDPRIELWVQRAPGQAATPEPFAAAM